MKKSMRKETKVEQVAREHYGREFKYRGQMFRVSEVREYSGADGIYCVAVESGRVPKGDSQWVSRRVLREKLVAAEERRIEELEAEGMSTSDAQGVLLAEQMKRGVR